MCPAYENNLTLGKDVDEFTCQETIKKKIQAAQKQVAAGDQRLVIEYRKISPNDRLT